MEIGFLRKLPKKVKLKCKFNYKMHFRVPEILSVVFAIFNFPKSKDKYFLIKENKKK